MNIMRTKFTSKVKNNNSNNTFASTLVGEEKIFTRADGMVFLFLMYIPNKAVFLFGSFV